MQQMNFSPVPEQPLQTVATVHDRKEVALKGMISNVRETGEKLGTPSTYFSNGREYSVTSKIDSMVANAQSKVTIMENLLQEARHAADYRKEQAAAKILELVKANQELTTRYAEILINHPEVAADLENVLPMLASLSHKEAGATLH